MEAQFRRLCSPCVRIAEPSFCRCTVSSQAYVLLDTGGAACAECSLKSESKTEASASKSCGQPKPPPMKYREVENLIKMLVHHSQISDTFYFEILGIPLPELEGLTNLKIFFHDATKDEVRLSHPDAELRFLEILYHRIYKIFPSGEKTENLNDQYCTLRAEEIPEDEKNLKLHDRLMHVYHLKAAHDQQQCMQQKVYGAWEQYLGFEHLDTSPKEFAGKQSGDALSPM